MQLFEKLSDLMLDDDPGIEHMLKLKGVGDIKPVCGTPSPICMYLDLIFLTVSNEGSHLASV